MAIYRKAYELGSDCEKERQMINEGKIVYNGMMYILQTTRSKAAGIEGIIGLKGDFFTIDSEGNPYPIDRQRFLANHKPVDGEPCIYARRQKPYDVWLFGEDVTAAVQFAVDHGRIQMDHDNLDQLFKAKIGDEWVTASNNAAVVFKSITLDKNGVVTDVDFYFSEK